MMTRIGTIRTREAKSIKPLTLFSLRNFLVSKSLPANGLWTASDIYWFLFFTPAKEVIKSDMEEAGDEDVIRKVQGDLGGLATDQEIRTKLNECYGKALEELAA